MIRSLRALAPFVPSVLLALPVLSKEPATKAPPVVLVTVDGVAVTRAEVMERAFRLHGTAVLNELVDELLVRKAAAAAGVAANESEIASRMKGVLGQFGDEATLAARLEASGSSLAEMKERLRAQVLREELVKKSRGLAVTDAELTEYFDGNREKLGQPEAVRVRHLQVATERQATDFALALKAGADFAALARPASLDAGTKERGGDLGFVSRGMLAPELERVVFALKPGEVSPPLKTALGWHLLKAEERRPAKQAVLADIREDLRRALLADKVTQAWPAYIQELRDRAKYEPGK